MFQIIPWELDLFYLNLTLLFVWEYFMTISFILKYVTTILFHFFVSEYFYLNLILLFVSEYFVIVLFYSFISINFIIRFVWECFITILICYFISIKVMTIRFVWKCFIIILCYCLFQNILSQSYAIICFRIFHDNQICIGIFYHDLILLFYFNKFYDN